MASGAARAIPAMMEAKSSEANRSEKDTNPAHPEVAFAKAKAFGAVPG